MKFEDLRITGFEDLEMLEPSKSSNPKILKS
jgi:hypothetical protein